MKAPYPPVLPHVKLFLLAVTARCRYPTGMNLRQLRAAAGRTSDDVARLAGITVDRYRRLERGESRVLASEIAPLAAALGVSALDLLPPPPEGACG